MLKSAVMEKMKPGRLLDSWNRTEQHSEIWNMAASPEELDCFDKNNTRTEHTHTHTHTHTQVVSVNTNTYRLYKQTHPVFVDA